MTVIGFALSELVPGNPAQANLGERAAANPAIVKQYRERYGLDKPIVVQYERYLSHLLHGNLGESEISGRPVRDDLNEFIPATAELALASMLLSIAIGIPLGVLAAWRRRKITDHLIRFSSLAGISIPPFWLALVALYLLFYKYGLFPGTGRLDPIYTAPPHVTGFYTVDALLAGQGSVFENALQHLLLPALVLAATNIGIFIRFTRSAVLEVLDNDFVRTAYGKGLPPRIVISRHVLRAALPPVLTVVGLAFANVLTGTVFVESVFSWPGIGQYSYLSSTSLDLPAIVGVMLFVGFVYIVVNLIVEILHGVIDPRVKAA
jgi:peptide/nickel transport system permease protein